MRHRNLYFFVLVLMVLNFVACERIPEWQRRASAINGQDKTDYLKQIRPWLWTCRGQQVSYRMDSGHTLLGRDIDEFFDWFRSSSLSIVDATGSKTIMGTAFLWDGKGYLLTLNHWVEQTKDIECRNAELDWSSAKLVGSDRPLNLALLKVDLGKHARLFENKRRWIPRTNLPPVGETVSVLSSAYPGVLDQFHVQLQVARPNLHTGVDNALVLFLPPAPEVMKGGILVDSKAHVLGYLFLPNRSVWGAAISVSRLGKLVGLMRQTGKVERAFLGMRLRFGSHQGFVVQEVEVGGPAYQAGLRAQDVLVSWNGQDLNSLSDWPNIGFSEIGKKVPLTYLRNKKQVETQIDISSSN